MYSAYSVSRRARLAVALSLAVAAPSVLAAQATDLDQLVVTATRTAQTQDATLAPVTVIDRAEIERRQATSLQDLLRGELGVQIANNGGIGKSTSLFLRGTESDHVLVMIDGVKIGSATSGGAALQDIPVEQIERIEIVRGPFSSLYGSEAIGGVIQIFTRRPQGVFTPTFSASVGSHDTQRYSAGAAGRTQGDLSEHGGWYSVTATHDETNGINAYLKKSASYYDPDRDGYRNNSLGMQGGWRFNRQWDFDVHALRAEFRNEYDGSSSSGNVAKGAQQVVGGRLRYAPTDALKFTLSGGTSADMSDAYYDGAYVSTFDTHRAVGSLQADANLGPGVLSAGFDWQQDHVDSTEVYDLDSRTDRGVFAQWQQSFGTQSLQTSLRHDDNSQFGGENTGSILWGWNFTRSLRLTASYGSAYKAPTFNELYYPAYGNADLQPETSHSAEVGLRGDHGWGNWSLNAYETHVDDLISYDSSLTDDAHPYGQPNNVDKARIRGVEAGAGTTIANWTLRTTLTWQDPRADGDSYHGNLLARRSRQSGRVDADYKFGRFTVGGSVYGAAHSYDELSNSTRLPGYALIGLHVDCEVTRDWHVAFSADNLFDRDYETAAWYAQPGRTYMLTLRYHPAQ